jgi:hypothetical protein
VPAKSLRCEGKVEASGAAKTNRIIHPSKSSLAFRQQKYKWHPLPENLERHSPFEPGEGGADNR